MKKLLFSLLGISVVSFGAIESNCIDNLNITRNNLSDNAEIANANKYTVTFVSNGGTLVPSQEIDEGETATDPSASCTKTNYTLDGWYTKNASQSESGTDWGEKFDFATTITADTTLYAKWTSIPTPSKNWYDRYDWYNYTAEATSDNIGKELNMVINNHIHKVRLIDIDHDDLSDGSGKAHCTFQIVTLLSDTNGDAIKVAYGNERNYANSSISLLPEGLQAQIKSVNKKYSYGGSPLSKSPSFRTQIDKLFNLGLYEYGETTSWMKHEGTHYAYYDSIGSDNSDKRLFYDANKHTYNDGNYSSWSRTTAKYDDDCHHYICNYKYTDSETGETKYKLGSTSGMGAASGSLAIAPAFCI